MGVLEPGHGGFSVVLPAWQPCRDLLPHRPAGSVLALASLAVADGRTWPGPAPLCPLALAAVRFSAIPGTRRHSRVAAEAGPGRGWRLAMLCQAVLSQEQRRDPGQDPLRKRRREDGGEDRRARRRCPEGAGELNEDGRKALEAGHGGGRGGGRSRRGPGGARGDPSLTHWGASLGCGWVLWDEPCRRRSE